MNSQANARPETQPLRILYVYIYCNMGGVTSVLKQRALHLALRGYHMDALFQVDYGGREDLLRAGLSNVFIERDIRQAAIRMTQSGRYDVVTVIDMPHIAGDLVERTSARIHYEIHTPMEEVLLTNDNDVLRAVEKIVVPSRWSKAWVTRHYPGVPAERVVVCPNIVDPSVFFPPQTQAAKKDQPVVWVGKFGAYKNWPLALEIVATYLQGDPARQAYFVTGGRLTSEVLDTFLGEITRRALVDRVIWLHDLEHSSMAELYRDIAARGGSILSCSKSESFCMVLHEAGRCGVPNVATAAGAVAELVENDSSGVIFDETQPERAVVGLERLATDPAFRTRIIDGLNARLRAFDPEHLISAYLSSLSSGV